MSDQWGEVKALIIKLNWLDVRHANGRGAWEVLLRSWQHIGADPVGCATYLRRYLPHEFKTET